MKRFAPTLLAAGLQVLSFGALAAPPAPASATSVEGPAVDTSVSPVAKPSAKTSPDSKGKGKATDHVELDQTTITGNRELPNVMVIVPWKEAAPGEPGKAGHSLLDEALMPLDREEFRRELQYDAALRGKPVPTPAAATPVTKPSSP
ncbi:MAG: hypothetical protein RJB26_168 [Pseudomonadota bacterium]|jgi:hypothetical protein